MKKDVSTEPPAGALSFSSRMAMTVGLICLSPMMLGNALSYYDRGGEMDHFYALFLFLLLVTAAMTVLLLRTQPALPASFLFTGVILLLAIYLRAACLNHVTGDYANFLTVWVSNLRENGGFAALGELQSDYNVPYLYLLALISYIPLDDLLLIKFVSITADLLMALTAVAVARELGVSPNKRLIILAGVLFAPTVWLNSAYWAQCDVLYTLFALLCFLCVLRGRPWLAVCMAGLAFAFKLQVIFFLPMLVVFMMTGRLKWRHLAAFPAVYLLVGAPALALGRSFLSLFTIYGTQVTQYSGWLNLNAPSAYSFLSLPEGYAVAPFFTAGLAAAALFLSCMLYWISQRRTPISDKTLLSLALVFCAAIPWCLPSMHERYFYMADVFAVIYAIIHPKRFYIAPMMIYASYAGYHAYLMGAYLPYSMWVPALMVVAVAVMVLRDLKEQLKQDETEVHERKEILIADRGYQEFKFSGT